MSTSIIGFMSDESEQYKKHSKVLIACIEANIEKLPKETAKFFGEETPMKHLLEETLEVEITKYEYNEDMMNGYEIIVSEIPNGVHKIRFFNSY